MDFYDFTKFSAAAKSLIHLINLHGDNLTGIEVGVARAENLCFLAQSCKNIKEMHGVDAYVPYKDYLCSLPDDGTPRLVLGAKDIEAWKVLAYHNIKWSGEEQKIIMHEEDSEITAKRFNDYFDFVFLDSYLTYKQAYQDLVSWYPTLKHGGIFSGHDYNSPDIQKAVEGFLTTFGITSKLSVYDDCWVFIK
jgi:hypothetical protein